VAGGLGNADSFLARLLDLAGFARGLDDAGSFVALLLDLAGFARQVSVTPARSSRGYSTLPASRGKSR